MKPKILIVDAFQGLGGEEEISYLIYRNIDRNKFKVYLAGPEDAPYFKKNRPRTDEWIKCKTKGKMTIKSMIEFRALVKKYEINIVNVHGYSAGYFVRVACVGMRNVKIVWTMHLNISDVSSMRKIKKVVSTKIENILCNHSLFTDEIICVSKDSVKQLTIRRITKTPITVIYNGINIRKFESVDIKDNETKELVLGFVSRLSVQKGIPILLEAIKKCREQKLNVRLIIAGDGELKEDIEEYIQQNCLEDSVKMLGFQNDVRYVFKIIDLVVLPSYYECFPVIILEAGASGIPTVASAVNGVPEQIIDGYNGRLFEAGDCDGLVEAIKDYYYDRHKIRIHGINARERICEEFDEFKMISKYQKVYSNLINGIVE